MHRLEKDLRNNGYKDMPLEIRALLDLTHIEKVVFTYLVKIKIRGEKTIPVAYLSYMFSHSHDTIKECLISLCSKGYINTYKEKIGKQEYIEFYLMNDDFMNDFMIWNTV